MIFSLARVEDDIASVGKHLLIETVEKSVKRHYTLVRCLEKTAYYSLVDAIKSNGKVKPKSSQLGKGEFQLAVKNYKIVGGISELMHRSEIGNEFIVKGIMGKSLGLQKHGNHVAFLAGTGILVFLDLVSMIAKANLGLLPNSDNFAIFS